MRLNLLMFSTLFCSLATLASIPIKLSSNFGTSISEFKFSPDSKKVVFVQGSSKKIYSANLDGTEKISLSPVVGNKVSEEIDFRITNDSQYVVFTLKNNFTGDSNSKRLYIAAIDGSYFKKLTTENSKCVLPRTGGVLYKITADTKKVYYNYDCSNYYTGDDGLETREQKVALFNISSRKVEFEERGRFPFTTRNAPAGSSIINDDGSRFLINKPHLDQGKKGQYVAILNDLNNKYEFVKLAEWVWDYDREVKIIASSNLNNFLVSSRSNGATSLIIHSSRNIESNKISNEHITYGAFSSSGDLFAYKLPKNSSTGLSDLEIFNFRSNTKKNVPARFEKRNFSAFDVSSGQGVSLSLGSVGGEDYTGLTHRVVSKFDRFIITKPFVNISNISRTLISLDSHDGFKSFSTPCRGNTGYQVSTIKNFVVCFGDSSYRKQKVHIVDLINGASSLVATYEPDNSGYPIIQNVKISPDGTIISVQSRGKIDLYSL